MHALNGVKFDPQAGSVLHIELARSNSRRKRKPEEQKPQLPNTRETSSEDGGSDTEESSGADNAILQARMI
ncbi:hypothetical protein REPUB_Repub13aG0185900 [Reevesia pubescens]